jgi:hypothetical protein
VLGSGGEDLDEYYSSSVGSSPPEPGSSDSGLEAALLIIAERVYVDEDPPPLGLEVSKAWYIRAHDNSERLREAR